MSNKIELFYKIISLSHRQQGEKSKLSQVFEILNQYKAQRLIEDF